MDLIVLVGIATALLVILLTVLFFTKSSDQKDGGNATAGRRDGVPQRVEGGIQRRAQIARNQRNRMRGGVANAGPSGAAPTAGVDSDDDEDDEGTRPGASFSEEKMGTKKRAKLEAKAEKRAQREVELKMREDKKKQDALADEERRKQDEKEKEEERKLEEAERLAREEKERKDYEEYLKMKEAFSIEEEGFDEDEGGERENQLQEFVNYIKTNKIIVLEDLASQFKLKTQATIDRITDLQKDGILTGVIDDRGKFIYISEDELKAVAKFIKQRGRVSITELAESSNNLINLVPVVAK